MHSSVLFQFQKNFSIFDLGVDTSNNPITNPPATFNKAKLKITLNGNTLVEGTDYDVVFMNGSVAVIREFIPSLETSSILVISLYQDDAQTVLSNTITPAIYPLGGVLSLNKSTVTKCDTINISASLNSRATIGFNKNGVSSPVKIKSGSGTLQNIQTSDIQYQTNPEIGAATNIVFNSGILMNNPATNTVIEVVSTERAISSGQSFIIETTYNPTVTGIDAFMIDGVGFALVEQTGQPTYEILKPFDPSESKTRVGLNAGDIFRVEATISEYILTVGSTEVGRFTRNTRYSSNRGNFNSSTNPTQANPFTAPYNTPVVFHPTTAGTGYVEVAFSNGVGLRQNITADYPNQPYFGVSNTFQNTCPDNTFNLYSLTDQNNKAGYTLEFHTVASPTSDTTKVPSMSVGAGTYYAVQKQNGAFCYGQSRQITVNIVNCCVNVTQATLNGPDNAVKGQAVSYSVSGLNGTPPYAFGWTVTNGTIIGSSTSDVISISPTAHPLAVQVVINNCSASGVVTRNKSTNVKLNCSKVVTIDLACKLDAISSIVGTLQGVVEPNRVTAWGLTSITFKTEIGQHNYHFIINGGPGETPIELTLKNVVCT